MDEVLRIRGGLPLRGEIRVQGAKNSVLPIMAASLLANGECVIHNCPHLRDVDITIRILEHLGCNVTRQDDTVVIDSRAMTRHDIPDALMREMRSSVVFLGAIAARAGEAVLSAPGGCELGPRPVDLHIAALHEFAAAVTETGGKIRVKLLNEQPPDTVRHIAFSIPSVGATENTMLIAARSPGRTVITNPAREPEIADLQAFLRKIGVNISGADRGLITIDGTPNEHTSRSAVHTIIPDRIAAATYLSAVALTGGKVTLTDTRPEHIEPVITALAEMGCELERDARQITLTGSGRLKAPRPISTEPYPGFPTDAQPPIMAACLKAEGTTAFVENIFENRYRHVDELRRLGADIKLSGRTALVCGVEQLHGAEMRATDLRGGAALVVAALGAHGESVIGELRHIDRGYDSLCDILCTLGADCTRE